MAPPCQPSDEWCHESWQMTLIQIYCRHLHKIEDELSYTRNDGEKMKSIQDHVDCSDLDGEENNTQSEPRDLE